MHYKIIVISAEKALSNEEKLQRMKRMDAKLGVGFF